MGVGPSEPAIPGATRDAPPAPRDNLLLKKATDPVQELEQKRNRIVVDPVTVGREIFVDDKCVRCDIRKHIIVRECDRIYLPRHPLRLPLTTPHTDSHLLEESCNRQAQVGRIAISAPYLPHNPLDIRMVHQ